MLKIENLPETVGGEEILKEFGLTTHASEMHAIMESNGSMASTPSMCSGAGRSPGSGPLGSGLRRSTGEYGSTGPFLHNPHARAAA